MEAAARSIGFEFHGVDAPRGPEEHYGLRYAEFVVPLVKAVQEQQEQIEALRVRLQERDEALTRQLEANTALLAELQGLMDARSSR